jgi:hypothetical protein
MRIGRIFEGDHSMAPSPTERLNAIEPRLEAVESALGIRPASTGLKRFKELVAKYPLWVTIFVAVASIMATVACTYFPRWTDQGKKDRSEAINRQIEDFLNSAGGVSDKLNSLQITTTDTNATLKTLQPYIQGLVQHQFDAASKLSPQALRGQLPSVAVLIQVARTERIQIPQRASDQLSKNLLRVPDSALGYWPATAELVSFRSQGHGSSGGLSMPDCTDAPPHPLTVSSVDANGGITGSNQPFYENCRFTIDSPKDNSRFNAFIRGAFPDIEFRHCLIVYRGGSFTLITRLDMDSVPLQSWSGRGKGGALSHHGPTMAFTNCEFDFSVPDRQPPPNAKLLLQALLEQPTSPGAAGEL